MHLKNLANKDIVEANIGIKWNGRNSSKQLPYLERKKAEEENDYSNPFIKIPSLKYHEVLYLLSYLILAVMSYLLLEGRQPS